MRPIKKSACRPTSATEIGFRSRRSRRGFTIAELMVASVVFLLLLGSVFAAFHQSSSAMLKGTTQSGLLQDAQVFRQKLTRAIELGPVVSLTVAAAGNGMSVLSAEAADGRFQFDPAHSVAIWQNYQVFYFDAAASELRVRDLSVIGFPEEVNPGPIENWDAAQPIESYFTGGQPILHHVVSAVFRESLPGLIHVEVEMRKERAKSPAPEVLKFEVNRSFRN